MANPPLKRTVTVPVQGLCPSHDSEDFDEAAARNTLYMLFCIRWWLGSINNAMVLSPPYSLWEGKIPFGGAAGGSVSHDPNTGLATSVSTWHIPDSISRVTCAVCIKICMYTLSFSRVRISCALNMCNVGALFVYKSVCLSRCLLESRPMEQESAELKAAECLIPAYLPASDTA